jgi:RecG-like helicase
MKQIIMFLLAGITLATVVSCKSGGPEDVAKKFFQAIQDKKFDEAKKYATKESQSLLDMLATFSKSGADSSQAKPKKEEQFDVTNVKVTGDNATAEIVAKDKKSPLTINLKKEEGKWKVAFDKSSIMKMAMDAQPAHMDMNHDPSMGVDSTSHSGSSIDSMAVDSAK